MPAFQADTLISKQAFFFFFWSGRGRKNHKQAPGPPWCPVQDSVSRLEPPSGVRRLTRWATPAPVKRASSAESLGASQSAASVLGPGPARSARVSLLITVSVCCSCLVPWMQAPLAFKGRCLQAHLQVQVLKVGGTRCGVQNLHSSGRSLGFWVPSWLWGCCTSGRFMARLRLRLSNLPSRGLSSFIGVQELLS